MADLVEDIKTRLDVLTLISSYLQLKKMGRSYKALSPFKNEKTPSFVVSPEKNIWHDFSTGKGGDIFTFVQEYEGVSFSEALKILAEKSGLDPADYRLGNPKINKERKSEKDEMYRIHEIAMEKFHENLFMGGSESEKVLKYLVDRGVKDDTIKFFKIGFARDSFDDLSDYLLKKGFSKQSLLKAGLVSSKTLNAEKVFDKFRGRLIFPIFDVFSRVVAFGGRALKEDQMPKYLNSPETLIYFKSKILYGLSFSKNDIKKEDSALLVEGYFDVILPFQEGIKNVVATSGTALTAEHIKLLSRYTKKLITAFDADEAGFNATLRAFELLNSTDLSMRCISEMYGKDPADFALKDAEVFKKTISDSLDFMDFFINKLLQKYPDLKFESKKKIIGELLPYLKNLSPIIRDHYIRKLSLKLGFEEQVLYDEVEGFYLNNFSNIKKNNERSHESKIYFTSEEILFALILEFPYLIAETLSEDFEKCFSEEFKSVYKMLLTQYNANRDLDKWDFTVIEAENLKSRLTVLALYGEEKYGNFSKDILKDEIFKILESIKKDFQKKRLKNIQTEIANAEACQDEKKLMILLKEQHEILSKE